MIKLASFEISRNKMQRSKLALIKLFALIKNGRIWVLLLSHLGLPLVAFAQHAVSGDEIKKQMPTNGYVMRCIPGKELVFRNIGNYRDEVSKLILKKDATYLSVDLYEFNSPKAFECSVGDRLISVVLSSKKIGVDDLIDRYGVFYDRCDRSINAALLKIDQKIVMDEMRISGDDCDQDAVYVVFFKMVRRGAGIALQMRDINGLAREISF